MKLLYKEFCSHITGTIDLTKSRDEAATIMQQAYCAHTGKKKTAHALSYFRNDSGMYHAVRDLLEKIKTDDFSIVVQKFQLLYPAFHPDWKSALETGLVIMAGRKVGNYTTGEYVYRDATAQAIREAGLNFLSPIVDHLLNKSTITQAVLDLREVCSYVQDERANPLPY